MSRFRELSNWHDGNTLLIGDVALLPDGRLEYGSFNVIVYIRSIDFDVTKAFSEKQLAGFKQSFELFALEKYGEELKGDYRDKLEEGA